MGGLPDQTLVALAQAGDEDAYVELYRRHSPMAARAIRRITRNAEDTEDVLQETSIRALVHLKSFDGRSAFSTWLTRIAVNSALMLLRKRRNRPETSIDSDPDRDTWLSRQLADPSPSPETMCLRLQEVRQLREAVSQLPPLLRNVIVARHGGDMPVKQVAAAVGITEAAAKSRLLRASLRLRALLTEDDFTERRRALNSQRRLNQCA
ncbi:RNA polymerase sigma factor [Granulicella tundricola]|uniref:RNA polymerase sigma factor n=1 Tax=Granulicella tundricola TaxID=940615 RepID=UPI0038CC12E6